MLDLKTMPEGVILRVKVVPGSSRDRIVGELAGALKVTVTAPPERGRANKSVRRLLSEALNVQAAQVQIIGGLGSPAKTLRISGASAEAIQSLVNTGGASAG